MLVRDLMIKEFHCCSPTDTIIDVAQAMKRHNVGAIPVCDDGQIVGIITDRDITIECAAAGVDPRNSIVQEFMTANPLTVSPDTDLKQTAELMGREQIRRLPVVQNGKLVGMISLGDLAFHLDDDTIAEVLRRISVPVRMHKARAAGH